MSDGHSLSGKTILITGASSGIGRETAILAAEAGASLVITGRDRHRLEETLHALTNHGSRHTPPRPSATPPQTGRGSIPHFVSHFGDLTVAADLDALVDAVPVLNGVVHCAGIVGPLPVKFITRTDIGRMFEINYIVPVELTGKLLRKKKIADGASFLFMSTIATRNPYFGGALYSGSKAALEAYSRTLALELHGRSIRSNCLQAGLVDTPMIENPSEEKMQEEAMERYLKRYPLGVGQPADVARAILYFLSDDSKWVSGTSLIMGGE